MFTYFVETHAGVDEFVHIEWLLELVQLGEERMQDTL